MEVDTYAGITEKQANGMLRVVIETKANIARLCASAVEEKEAFLEAHEEKLASYDAEEKNKTESLIRMLQKYILEHPHSRHLKTKSSLSLYAGTMEIKKPKGKFERDKDFLESWMQAYRDDLVTTETKEVMKFDWEGLKKELEVTPIPGGYEIKDPISGRSVEGVVFIEGEPVFEIKL